MRPGILRMFLPSIRGVNHEVDLNPDFSDEEDMTYHFAD